MIKFFVACFAIFSITFSFASNEKIATGGFKHDVGLTFNYLLHGSYLQFTQPGNLLYAGVAAPSLWYSFEHDQRLSDLGRSKKMPKHVEIIGELGVFFSMPIAPAGVYLWARQQENTHVMQYMMETLATTWLALAESALISFIQVHERPETSETNFWEKAFRGNSSFPSGHMIPYAALTFKTFQFYGPWWTVPPLVLTVWASQQRVMDAKHYASDVVGGFFLAAFASEGVRAAANYKGNHPVYKWLFEREFNLGILRHEDAIGPMVSIRF
jgi:membrane-associated phospholipid phosphatase